MTRDEETRLWIKTHLRLIERPEEVEDYLRAYRYLDSRRPPAPPRRARGQRNHI